MKSQRFMPKDDDPRKRITKLLKYPKKDKPTAERKEKFSLIFYNKKFIKEVKSIRKKFGIPKKGLTTKKACEWIQKIDLKNYDKDLEDLLLVANASERWKDAIEYFMIFNNKKPYHLFPEPLISYFQEDKKGFMHLRLEIFLDTSIKDIKNNWETIENNKKALVSSYKKLKKSKVIKDKKAIFYIMGQNRLEERHLSLLPRNRKIKELKRYKKIYELKDSGKTISEIARNEEVQIMYENKTKDPVTFENITKDLDRFKKHIESNLLI